MMLQAFHLLAVRATISLGRPNYGPRREQLKPMRSENRAKALLAFAFVSACAVGALDGSYCALADPLNPFGSSVNPGPVTPEEKARREQVRNELYTRYAADYRMPVPFVSEASITALEAAIARYQQIAAAGGWPMVGDNATLRPGDTSADIATIRKHLMIEGDLPGGNAGNPNFGKLSTGSATGRQIQFGLKYYF